MVGKAVLVCLRLFLVFGDILAVKAFDVVDIDGDASLIAVAGPLRVLLRMFSSQRRTQCELEYCTHHETGALVKFDIKVVVEFNDALFLHPFLGVGELANGTSDVKLAGS